ncbi:hypothetical protein [Gluconobacter morbifer]|nr:hypothetical protein [Gluconobacter morbifer]
MAFSHTLSRLSLAAILATGLAAVPAHAMTAKECHVAFQTAKKNGTLNGQAYKAFKAANCGDNSKAAAPATAADATPTATSKANPPDSEPTGTKATIPAKAPVAASGNVVFPSAVSSKYSSMSAGKARLETCVAQYNANKASGGNGSLKWIQKGGGYWSQCNARLKGE